MQLAFQPAYAAAGGFQVIFHQLPVQNQVIPRTHRLRRQLQVLRGDGAAAALGQKADLAVRFQNGGLYFVGVKIPGHAGLTQKLVQINGRAGKILLKNGAALHQYQRPPAPQTAHKDTAAGSKMHDPGHQPVHDHGGDRAVPLFQIRRQLGSDRTGGHGVQIVKGAHLGNLPLAAPPRQQKHPHQ